MPTALREQGPPAQPNGDRRASHLRDECREELADLAWGRAKYFERPVGPADPAERSERRPGPVCYLKWTAEPPAGDPIDLGPSARWLVAVDLLAELLAPALDLEDLLRRLARQRNETDATRVNDRFRALFLARSRQNIVDPLRLSALQNAARDKLDEALFELVLENLSERCAAARGGAITREQFHLVRVPVSGPKSAPLGTEPLEWFRSWLQWGVGIPADAGAWRPVKPVRIDPQQLDAVMNALTPPRSEDDPDHRNVVHVHGGGDDCWPESLAAAVADRLRANPDTAAVRLGYVSLDRRQSRKSVVRALYRLFALDDAPLADLSSRQVDLVNDLAPIRRALTVSPVVLVFGGWDNPTGWFESLHGYLCVTYWGEFLRSLTLPDEAAWRSMARPTHPQGRIVVASRSEASEIAPWARLSVEFKRTGDDFAVNAGAPTGDDATWLAQWFDQERDRMQGLALRLIAASVNGLRRDTLRRCFEQWALFFPVEALGQTTGLRLDRRHIDAAIDAALAFAPPGGSNWIAEVEDEDSEAAPTALRLLELERRPRASAPSNEPDTALVFASRAQQALFIDAWLKTDDRLWPSDPATIFIRVNFLLAEENIRQSTSRMKHRPASGVDNVYALRRVVQAIYHGLVSLGLPANAFARKGATAGSLYGPILSVDPAKRMRYLYLFLFRHCVEADQWRTARAFGRFDVRLDLLTLFILPDLGRRMLASAIPAADESIFPAERVPEAATGLHNKYLERDPYLRCDLLEAIARAGIDLGGQRGSTAALWAISMLPRSDLSDAEALLPQPEGRYAAIAHAAAKLRIDWEQWHGPNDHLRRARALCYALLERVGVGRDALEPIAQERRQLGAAPECRPLREIVADLLARQPRFEADQELSATLEFIFGRVERRLRGAPARMACAELLQRLGEMQAAEADSADDERKRGADPQRDAAEVAPLFAEATALFWLADRLRSSAAAIASRQLGWPLAAARGLRYHVRCAMKLAQLISEATSHAQGHALSNALMEHAGNRLGLLTRHYFEFPRERVSMLLLEAARVRGWLLVRLARRRRRFEEWSDSDHQRTFDLEQKKGKLALDRAALEQQRNQLAVERKGARKKSAPVMAQIAALDARMAAADAQITAVQTEIKALDMARPAEIERYWIFVESQVAALQSALGLFDEAEALLVALGWQPQLSRRLLLDRAKHATAAVELHAFARRLGALNAHFADRRLPIEAYARQRLVIARFAISLLATTAAGDAYWENICRRQERSMARATLDRDDKEPR